MKRSGLRRINQRAQTQAKQTAQESKHLSIVQSYAKNAFLVYSNICKTMRASSFQITRLDWLDWTKSDTDFEVVVTLGAHLLDLTKYIPQSSYGTPWTLLADGEP